MVARPACPGNPARLHALRTEVIVPDDVLEIAEQAGARARAALGEQRTAIPPRQPA
jgi:hypothetical protein